MKLSLYRKIWIIYLITLVLVFPYVYNYYIEFENLDTQGIFYGMFTLMYVMFIPILLIFIYAFLWIKKKQDQYTEKSIKYPEKSRKVRIFTIKMSAIAGILSLIALFIIIYVDYDFYIKTIFAMAIMIIGIILGCIAFYKQIKM